MSYLVTPANFFREIAKNTRLKFTLTGCAFIGLVIPTAILMTLGFPQRYALVLMLIFIVPFQYAVFCIIQKLDSDRRTVAKQRAQYSIQPTDRIGNLAIAYLDALSAYGAIQSRQLEVEFLKTRIDQIKPKYALELSVQLGFVTGFSSRHLQLAGIDPTTLFSTFANPRTKTRSFDEIIHIQRRLLEEPMGTTPVLSWIPSRPVRQQTTEV